MDKFIIEGGRPLKGTIRISGSKNAALPILVSSLLTREKCVVSNVPELRDIRTTHQLLKYLGKKCDFSRNVSVILPDGKLRTDTPYSLVKQMRASVLVAGPLLARFHRVRISLPGGCAIGVRPIDIHIEAFEKLGARIYYKQGYVIMTAARLKGARIRFKFPSVGATENLMMCAVLVPGTTVLENCAMEPEISDLAQGLKGMGAVIKGEGTRTIKICGVRSLHGTRHSVIPDRIETGTYMIACAAAGGEVLLEGAAPEHLESLVRVMRKAGVRIRTGKDQIFVRSTRRPGSGSIVTGPYPGFPTDLQGPWMSFMCIARKKSRICEKIFENRFIHVLELARMGAHITVSRNTAVVKGVRQLSGAPVMASDIRAGAALVVAALAAKGRSEIRRVYHIDRGYEKIEDKLKSVGANIKRIRRDVV